MITDSINHTCCSYAHRMPQGVPSLLGDVNNTSVLRPFVLLRRRPDRKYYEFGDETTGRLRELDLMERNSWCVKERPYRVTKERVRYCDLLVMRAAARPLPNAHRDTHVLQKAAEEYDRTSMDNFGIKALSSSITATSAINFDYRSKHMKVYDVCLHQYFCRKTQSKLYPRPAMA